MQTVDHAILLLAGRGRRLGQLTEHQPKCLIDVAGATILERALAALEERGLTQATLVVGYRAKDVEALIGERFGDISVDYVLNERYDETNTAYSLWLARRRLEGNCLLIEGDILFNAALLEKIESHTRDEQSVWAALEVERWEEERIMLGADETGRISSVVLVDDPAEKPDHVRYKCAGIQLLRPPAAKRLAARLDEVIEGGRERVFADLVLASVFETHPASLCPVGGLRWAEVDTSEDLELAREIFEEPPRGTTESGQDEYAAHRLGGE